MKKLLALVPLCVVLSASTLCAQEASTAFSPLDPTQLRPLYPGDTALARVPLALYQRKPKWWEDFPPSTNQELKSHDVVRVLKREYYSTLFSQERWFLVQKICADNSAEDCQRAVGWVLGYVDGQENLVLSPSVAVPPTNGEETQNEGR